jgi:hypothetical protein
MGRIRPMALALRRGSLRMGQAVTWPVPGPRLRWSGLPRSGPRPKRSGSSRWPARRAPGARSPRVRPATARQWTGHDKVGGASTLAQRRRRRARGKWVGLTLAVARREGAER